MTKPSYPIRNLTDLGKEVAELRKRDGVKATKIAEVTGRSRDTLHRFENGRDITLSAFLDIILAMGYTIELTPKRMPTLQEMRDRFASDLDEY